MRQRSPTSTLFPYTTLFRSDREDVFHRHEERLIFLALWCWNAHIDSLHELLNTLERFCISFESLDRKSTRLNSSHLGSSYAVFCLKKKIKTSERAGGIIQVS